MIDAAMAGPTCGEARSAPRNGKPEGHSYTSLGLFFAAASGRSGGGAGDCTRNCDIGSTDARDARFRQAVASVLVTGPEDTIAPWREAPDIMPAPDASLGRHRPRYLTTSESEPVQRTVRLPGCS